MMKEKLTPLAKVTPPTLSGILQRQRLFRMIDRGRSRPIIWVYGPPGSGKTTLVASYVNARKLPSLWYQVDEGDTDISTFFYYMGLASMRVAPKKRRPLPLLTPEYLSGLTAFTRNYFRDLYDRLRSPGILILDNYQNIPLDSPMHEVMQNGLAEIPKGINVVIISHTDPPPSMARLRASDNMIFLGWDDLRLTSEESIGISQMRIRDQSLNRENLRALYDYTQGWLAGLILMLEQYKNLAVPKSINSQATHEVIFDYFAGEIFQRADKHIKEFLLKTSFLPRISVSVAEELTGNNQAGHILIDLVKRNYFTVKHADPSLTYEYHPLFRKFLLSQANNVFSKTQIREILRKTAQLLESTGQWEDAAFILREAGEWTSFARLIDSHATTLLTQGRGQTLESWLRSLPGDLLNKEQWLLYWLGLCRLPFDPAEGRHYLEKAFTLFRAKQDHAGMFLTWANIVEAIYHEGRNFPLFDNQILALESILKKSVPYPSKMIEAQVVAGMVSALCMRQPHHPAVTAWTEQAFSAIIETSLDINLRIQCGIHLSVYCLLIGDFARATLVIQFLRDAVRSPDISVLTQLTVKNTEAMYEWLVVASPSACIEKVKEALDIAEKTGVRLWDRHLLEHALAAALSSGDTKTAEEFLQRITEGLDQACVLDICYYHFLAAWYACLKKDVPYALEHVTINFKLNSALGFPFGEALFNLAAAQALHLGGNDNEASERLARATEIAGTMRSTLLEYMALLTEAQIALDNKQESKTLDVLRHAFGLGRRQGFFNTFGWQSPVMACLCEKALESGIEVDYTRSLIRKRNLVPEIPPFELEYWPWPIKVYTLGRFMILKDDSPLVFSGKAQKKPLDLLKALVALGAKEVSTVQLTDILWPDADGDAAEKALDTTLHRLRKLLGYGQALILTEGRLSLDPHVVWLDTWAFEHLLEKAEAAETVKKGKKPARALIEKALLLYRGTFLSEEAGQAWSLAFGERLRSKFLRNQKKLGKYYEKSEEWEKVVECCQKAIEVDPLAEECYRRLMVSYERMGRKAEAMAVYRRCRDTLSAMLGIEPSSETEFVYQNILKSAL